MNKDLVVSKKILFPFILVSSLFALWGFANAVTDPMVQAFKKVLELSNSEAAWVQMAFYGGYFCMALPAALFMKKYSYKVGILIGLGLYALVGVSFFMSIMFPTIYGVALGDLTEDQSKIGSAGLVMAIVGGALMPKLQGLIIDAGGNGVDDIKILGVSEVNFSFTLPLICFLFIAWYGLKVFKNALQKNNV